MNAYIYPGLNQGMKNRYTIDVQEKIIATCAIVFNVHDPRYTIQTRKHVDCRHACTFLLIEKLKYDYPTIASILKKERTTMIACHQKAIDLMETDPYFLAKVNEVRRLLRD